MKISREELKEIIRSPEYQGLPTTLAHQNAVGAPWWRMLDKLKVEAAKATIWEGCQIIATLFDTYGKSIESVKLDINVEHDRKDTYMTTSVYINDEHCFDGRMELEEDVLDFCDEIDSQETLNWAVGELDSLGNINLLSEIDRIDTAFEEQFTSAEQARKVARDVAAEIDSWFTKKLLERQVQEKIGAPEVKKGGPKL